MAGQTNNPHKDNSEHMHPYARFWAIDLHVHTPASKDVSKKQYGDAEPGDVVEAAIAAGLDAIAVTDHNTAEWCELVAEAAANTELVVLPGVEISTSEGHLLAIFDEGTPNTAIYEVLTELGIGEKDRGRLDAPTKEGFARAAAAVEDQGGLAVAAHADQDNGLLSLKVKAHVRRLLLDPNISAVELVRESNEAKAQKSVGGKRRLSFTRSSDSMVPGSSGHRLDGIGQRRTYVKASRPDLVGIRHALADPEIRVRTDQPEEVVHPWIERLHIAGEFFEDHTIHLCPDLNCLLGGTGTGKSLALEALRFAVDQQVAEEPFKAIRREVDSRLAKALGDAGTVTVGLVDSDGRRFEIERSFDSKYSTESQVFEVYDDHRISIENDVRELLPIAAFSQGEVLEYSREPVGRMKLIDDELELGDLGDSINGTLESLRENGEKILATQDEIADLEEKCEDKIGVKTQIARLKSLFKSDVVSQQDEWQRQEKRLRVVVAAVESLQAPTLEAPDIDDLGEFDTNADLLQEAAEIVAQLSESLKKTGKATDRALASAQKQLPKIMRKWDTRHQDFSNELDSALKKIQKGGKSLPALRRSLVRHQGALTKIKDYEKKILNDVKPVLAQLSEDREGLLRRLYDLRIERRKLRRDRTKELNRKTAGAVKLDIPSDGDPSDFRAALEVLSIGSKIRKPNLDRLARAANPIALARSLYNEDIDEIVEKCDISRNDVVRLLTNIEDRKLRESLFEMQVAEKHDVLRISFKKPETGQYTPIEQLAHGQKCTAVLVILLADGDKPVIVDQPEDALHAPWIEEYLVTKLRDLRGQRQYIFASRSPGLVVSADAELIVTLKATADSGTIEASGSLERFDLNELALYHLEGGPAPFDRRSSKLKVSIDSRRN